MFKGIKVIKKIGVLLLFLLMIFYISAVHRYGNFNVFGSPHRVFFGRYRYDNQGFFVTLTGKEKPEIEVSTITDKIVGKRIYSGTKDYKGNGREVYLHIGVNEYLRLSCGGGG